MSSIEKILFLVNKKEVEADWEDPKAPKDWPFKGEYEAKEIYYKYREELPNVIHGISFNIKQNERIGVVGRTGSGKSTLTLGLLRILELHQMEGKDSYIKLDDTKIHDVGLHELRNNVTIIPQDPVLFNGTVRSNIDPFNQYNQEGIIEALRKV